MRVEVFIDPASGWTWWTPQPLVQAEPRADEDCTGYSQRPAGQGLLLRLAGRWAPGSASANRPRRAAGVGSGPATATPGSRGRAVITAASGAGGAHDRAPRSSDNSAVLTVGAKEAWSCAWTCSLTRPACGRG